MSQPDMAAAWLRTPDLRFERPFITPEGLDLKIKLATAAQRATAFVIDGLIILSGLLAVVALSLLGGAMAGGLGHRLGQQAALVFITLGLFVWRNGYFIYFELGGRGATPGKRIMSIRVAARDGARLSAQAIFARNVLREVELMLPVTFLVLGASRPDAALFGAACLVWTGVLVFLPLMNRDRLRLGDMVAGTWVVRAPKPSLRVDVSEAGERLSPAFAFTPAQLAVYGERELQVLEQVIRQNNKDAVREVAARIRRKIEWVAGPGERDIDFLDAFYAALRRTLETGLLYGRRRRHKGEAP